jgi:lipid A 3-O-deacylase
MKVGLMLSFFISCNFYSKGQDDKAIMRQQLTISCDNNFFLLNGDDGYYTSGMFIKYSRISPKESGTSKTIFSYEIGQEIYNAHSRKILPIKSTSIPGGIEEIDRPIAGYLFGKVTRSTFLKDHKMFELGISIGTIGANSFGRNVQEFWHSKIGVKDYWNWVWDYQVTNAVGVNAHGTFGYSLIKQPKSFFQLTPVTQATLGNTFTNFSQAMLFQVGRLRLMSSSTFWNSRLQLTQASTDGRAVEWFLFYKPEIKYQLYNATIQGGYFKSDKGPIISDIKPFVVTHEVGVRFSVPRFSVGYTVVFQSREARGQFYRQSYASLIGSLCF